MKFNFHYDPGHGWLEVPMSLLCELGIADKITRYSYRRADRVYLEEDCDVRCFDAAMKAAGRSWSYVEKESNWVRTLTPYLAFAS